MLLPGNYNQAAREALAHPSLAARKPPRSLPVCKGLVK